MNFLAHRGIWKDRSEQNSFLGIKKALDLGFGVELDVRDRKGELIVSHDPSNSAEVLTFQEIVELSTRYDSMLAINVKCDGIREKLETALSGLDQARFFLFDMSIPETLGYLKSGLPTYMRLSEYEAYSELHNRSQGIWLDAFQNDWWLGKSAIFQNGIKICVVSPELHGRDVTDAWQYLRNIDTTANLYMCTDHPERARRYFE